MKKVAFGIVWTIAIYFLACALIGAVAGAVAGGNDPANAYEAGRSAGEAVVSANVLYIFLASLILGVLGSWKGFLPGTKAK